MGRPEDIMAIMDETQEELRSRERSEKRGSPYSAWGIYNEALYFQPVMDTEKAIRELYKCPVCDGHGNQVVPGCDLRTSCPKCYGKGLVGSL